MKIAIAFGAIIGILFNLVFITVERPIDTIQWQCIKQVKDNFQPSRSNESRDLPLGNFQITAYCLGGTMKNGQQVYSGAVAVDPSIIPLGTHIRIDGIGDFIACDTGAVIQGNIIDIYMPDYNDCINFGRQNKQVWIIN